MGETLTDAVVASPMRVPEGGHALATGQLLTGRYRVQRFIAAGGIGEVYEAYDALLDVPVAVKVLRPELSSKPGAHERFADEIRLARKVTHPNVCRVFDVAFDGSLFFFTMELHSGATLANLFRQHAQMPLDVAAPLVRQLLDGVGAAHAVDIVHTDLKPSNVLLTGKDGDRVVITDFGLAVPCCATLGCNCSMPHLIGTPAYMAPEQVTGGTILEGTDLFSIGVILYEMVTGALPWSGANAFDLANARLTGATPSARSRRPDLDPKWDAVITACLAREMKDRPRGVTEVARALAL